MTLNKTALSPSMVEFYHNKGWIRGIYYSQKGHVYILNVPFFFMYGRPFVEVFLIDFFAGSGTTMHAVNLLNAEDGGNRRCILVTNNEISEEEENEFTEMGINKGDDEWESRGIAKYVTWPKLTISLHI